jgi:hypothetical protein
MIDWIYTSYCLKKRRFTLAFQHLIKVQQELWQETKLSFFIAFILGILTFLVFRLYLYGEYRGSVLKSRQIGEAADYCYQKRGMLFINNKQESLELICQEMRIEVEVPTDCSKQQQLLEQLIEKDYKRSRIMGL